KIMKIVTDSTPMEEPKDPDTCNVFAIYKLMANEAEIAAMRERYTAGGMGYGHAKQALFEKYLETFAAFRQRRDELEQNLDEVEAILERGAERAREVAEGYLNAVKKATGLR
ncbi:MAG: tryptophan--tRNA ligase, partial [Lentisphaerae bacterium]|nr:tryptophan--tRNA ligase [Lentisphaerota bacterium]